MNQQLMLADAQMTRWEQPQWVDTSTRHPVTGRMGNISEKASKDSGDSTWERVPSPLNANLRIKGEQRKDLEKVKAALLGNLNLQWTNKLVIRHGMGKTELLSVSLIYFSFVTKMEIQKQDVNNSKKLNLQFFARWLQRTFSQAVESDVWTLGALQVLQLTALGRQQRGCDHKQLCKNSKTQNNQKCFVATVGEKEQETHWTEWLRGQGIFSEQGCMASWGQ